MGVFENCVRDLDSDDADIRRKAVLMLGEGDERAIEHLAWAMGDSNPYVRNDAGKTIARFGESAVDVLIRAVTEGEWYAQIQAISALGIIKDERAVGVLDRALDRHPMKYWAVEALGNIGKPAVSALIRAVREGDVHTCCKAIRYLGEIDDKKAVPALTEKLEKGKSSNGIPQAAAEALGKLGHKSATPALTRALEHSDSGVRWRAAQALGKLNDERAIGPLYKALEDEWPVNEHAAKSLVAIGADEDRVKEMMTDQESAEKRIGAAHVLGGIGNMEARDILIKTLDNDPSLEVRIAVVSILSGKIIEGTLKCEESLNAVVNALHDPDERLRKVAENGIRYIFNECEDFKSVERIVGELDRLHDSTPRNLKWTDKRREWVPDVRSAIDRLKKHAQRIRGKITARMDRVSIASEPPAKQPPGKGTQPKMKVVRR